MNNILTLMKQHTSVRDYTQQPIPKHDLDTILTAAQSAASSNFIQAYSVIAIENNETKKILAELTKNKHVATCATFLVFCANLYRLKLACDAQHQIIQNQLMENLLVSTIDVTLFAQNIVLAAESKGYGTCFIGGIRNQPEAVCQQLALPDLVYPVFGMTLGVTASQTAPKPRLPLNAILHSERYESSSYPELLKQYDETMQQYYQQRATNTKNSTWSESVGHFMGRVNRPHLKDFLAKQGFLAE